MLRGFDSYRLHFSAQPGRLTGHMWPGRRGGRAPGRVPRVERRDPHGGPPLEFRWRSGRGGRDGSTARTRV